MEIGAAAGCVSSLPSVREVRTPAKRVQSYDKKLTSLTVPLGAFGLLLGARSQSRQAPRPGQRLAPQRRYTAETTRVIGDWADGLVEAGEVKLVVSELPGSITQFRSVHTKGSRYGEEYDLGAGSTENLYLLKPESSDKPWLLIGAFSRDSQNLMLDMMKTEPALVDKVGMLVLQFFDGGQVPFIEDLVEQRSGDPLLIYASMPVILALKKKLPEAVMGKVSFLPIKNSSRLELDTGRVMRFVLTPTQKLPEATSAFDPLTGSLFTGKFFSAHREIGEKDSPFDTPGIEGWEAYVEDWYHLFDCYFFTKRAASSVRKLFMLCEALRGPDVTQLAPLHGPVVRDQCWKLMAKYEAWTEQKLRKETRRDFEVLVMYASAYGHTKTLAQAISKGLATSGVKVVDLNLEHCTADDVSAALQSADGFCIGSPTLGGEMPSQVKEALGVVLSLPADRRVPCGVFGSFGWSGEAVDELQFRLKDSGFPLAFDPIRAKFKPTPETLELCTISGLRLFQKLCRDVLQKRKSMARNLTKQPGSGALEAFGKMRTSQAVMTSLGPEGDIFTPVSWVNQASFEPLGITLAIPKPEEELETVTAEIEEPEFLLDSILKNHEKIRSRYVEGEDVTDILKQLLGTSDADCLDKAVEILDPYDDGLVTFDELRIAVQPGEPLRAMMEERKQAGSCPKESLGLQDFLLSLAPEGQSYAELAKAGPHKKAKSTNGCLVLAGCHAYLECHAVSVLDAGNYSLVYAEVTSGKVLDEKVKTDIRSVIESSNLVGLNLQDATQTTQAQARAPAMAAMPATSRRPQGATFAGATTSPAMRTAQRTALAARGGEERDVEMSEIQSWTGLTPGKEYRLQTMSIEAIADDTSTIRSLDWDRDRFDIEFRLERGTTYNSYIIKGAEKTAVVDTSHEKFEDLYTAALNKEVDLAMLDYLVVSHTEPDHSGLIGKVLEMAAAAGNEKLEVIGSKICILYLKNLVFQPFKSKVVQTGDQLDLGGGHTLEFVIAPNLHWPDTMFTFDHKTGILFTCDAFGMHYCSDYLEDVEGVKELLPHYATYYDCLMKPNARSVLTALKKINDFDLKAVATGHGPMLSQNLETFVDYYRSWSEKATAKIGPSVAVFWVSNFGESERLAQLFAHGLTSCSVNVEMHDLNAVDGLEITECLGRNEIIVFTAPPKESTGASNIGNIVANVKPKKHQFVVLDSCDDTQEPVALLRSRMLEANIPEALPAMEVTNRPITAQTLHAFEEAGMQIGKKLTQKSKAAAAKSQDKDLSKALGRLASSLYIVTAKKAGVRHAMVASWVTPASSKPLGVSVTIAKERAMEPLLRIGDSFTLNILEDGKRETLQVMKHFLQRFAPGVDRLEGVDHIEGSNGAAILRSACAYLECKIVSRMDASDHWVGYAEVVGGEVSSPSATAAVHHRKVGTYY